MCLVSLVFGTDSFEEDLQETIFVYVVFFLTYIPFILESDLLFSSRTSVTVFADGCAIRNFMEPYGTP